MHCCHRSVTCQSAVVNAPRSCHTLVLLAANLAQEHATQFLAPVLMFWVFFFYEAVEVALALVVGRRIELFLGRAIS
jgi:hypothetical protein